MVFKPSDYKGFAKATGIGAVTLFLLWLLVGCVGLAGPGLSVRDGMTQRGMFGWDQDGFTNEFVGTQEFGYTMAEGVIVLDADGNVDPVASTLTAYLKVEPRAREAGRAMNVGFAASTAQVQAMTTLIQALVPMLRAPPPLPEPEVRIP